MRDLFGSILFLSLKQRINMGEVWKYPLTQVPLSIVNVDGSMNKAHKAKLLQELKSCVASIKPASIDIMIFLHLLVDPPSTFGSIARYILGHICSLTLREVHFALDKHCDSFWFILLLITLQLKIVKGMPDHLIDQIPTQYWIVPKKACWLASCSLQWPF